MRGKYGVIHRLSNFIERAIPRRGSNSHLFVLSVIKLLQDLDKIQRENGFVDLTFHTNDGVWISHRGMSFVFIKPGQSHLTIMSGDWSDLARQLVRLIEKKRDCFEEATSTGDYRTWRINSAAMNVLVNFISNLSKPDRRAILRTSKHPRYFPADLRNLVLSEFKRDGCICPGVAGRSKHKVDLKRERIEYDHILPYSQGGPSTTNNIQILCLECNRAKGATAN